MTDTQALLLIIFIVASFASALFSIIAARLDRITSSIIKLKNFKIVLLFS